MFYDTSAQKLKLKTSTAANLAPLPVSIAPSTVGSVPSLQARDVSAKLGDFLVATDFPNIFPNNSAQSSYTGLTAIFNCGLPVWFPPGTYYTDRTVVINDTGNLWAGSQNACIAAMTGTPGFVNTAATRGATPILQFASTAQRNTLTNMTINGLGRAQELVWLSGEQNVLQGCYLTNSTGWALRFACSGAWTSSTDIWAKGGQYQFAATHCAFRDGRIDTCGGGSSLAGNDTSAAGGITLNASVGCAVSRCFIGKLNATGENQSIAIAIDGLSLNTMIHDNIFQECGTHQFVAICNSSGTSVVGNQLQGGTSLINPQIAVFPSASGNWPFNTLIANNTFRGGVCGGIIVNRCDLIAIVGNIFDGDPITTTYGYDVLPSQLGNLTQRLRCDCLRPGTTKSLVYDSLGVSSMDHVFTNFSASVFTWATSVGTQVTGTGSYVPFVFTSASLTNMSLAQGSGTNSNGSSVSGTYFQIPVPGVYAISCAVRLTSTGSSAPATCYVAISVVKSGANPLNYAQATNDPNVRYLPPPLGLNSGTAAALSCTLWLGYHDMVVPYFWAVNGANAWAQTGDNGTSLSISKVG